jgi:ribonuclease P protein component
MAASEFTFPKKEKLCSRKVIGALFSGGSSFVKYPFRVVFMKTENDEQVPVKVLITVSKKRIRRANKRNLLKRRIREAYRLNKHLLLPFLEENSLKIAVAFVYLPDEIMTYRDIEKRMKDSLQTILKKLESNTKK